MYVCVSLKNFATTMHRLSRHHFTTSLSLLAFSSMTRLISRSVPRSFRRASATRKTTKSSARTRRANRLNEGIPRAATADQTLSTPVSTRRELSSIGPLGRRLVVLHSPSRAASCPLPQRLRPVLIQPLAWMCTRSL